MENLISLFIFILGLMIGSFLNCLIFRLEINDLKSGQFIFGRSFCPYCKHLLNWSDLIPLLSFLVLKGKCRYCSQKISWQYPLVELSTGILFVLIFNFQFPIFNQFSTCPVPNLFWCGVFNFLNLFYYLIITSFLIIIFVYDLKHYIIPDKIIYPAILLALIFNFQFSIFNQFSIFKNSILSALGASIFFLFIVLISRGKWMGVGDIKLVFLMGLLLSFPNILVALFLAFFIGAIIGVGLIVAGKKNLKSEIPFGPFLVTGTFLALFFGENLINWYLNLFF